VRDRFRIPSAERMLGGGWPPAGPETWPRWRAGLVPSREPGGCQAELQMLIEGLALRRPPRHGEE